VTGRQALCQITPLLRTGVIAMLLITFAVVLAVNRIPMFGSNASARLRN
jgi:hypothetical protein